ncbi:protein Z-dependent protease inhibitor-like [Polyodon spathula]|uniref:protein Z-dependent protease inhibitor-like n=1 Tax=Polyodon spathula TaxID=7913 RepID=UPI001B7DFF6D|nr:protein Z-dependent protease inhibitor-like [Polyodon spathula]XP_041121849.1 protein Z-dependent protease inhibitor-like [Polyodon spathula]
MKRTLLFLVWVALFSTTCKTQDLSSADKPTVNDLASKNIEFAMNLYRKIASQHDDNIFFSPLCISSAFAMLSLGAKGNTYDQIIKGLNLDLLQSKDKPNIIPALFRQQQKNITSSQDLDLTLGGAMFVPQDFNVLETFLSQTKEYFNTDTIQLNPILTTNINEYVEKMTSGKIKELLKTVDPNTKLMLINYVLFKGKWEEPFDANYTEQARFYVNNYRIVSVPTMFRSDPFQLGYDDKLKLSILKLPYRGDASMIVLLPDKDADYNSIDEEISAEHFHQWLRMLKKIKMEVYFPKFKLEQSYKMKKILPALGITDLFNYQADLSGINMETGLKVSEVIHKAVIEVDEKGTEASSATVVGITGYSLPPSLKINRPFLFLIYHETTNSLLFMGRVVDPTI